MLTVCITGGGLLSVLIGILLPILAIGLLVFFFLSIYIGSSYLQEHLQVGGIISVHMKLFMFVYVFFKEGVVLIKTVCVRINIS